MDIDNGLISYISPIKLPELSVKSFNQLIFDTLQNRSTQSEIIIGHVGNDLIRINLHHLQSIVRTVYWKVHELGLSPGDTVLLCRLEGGSELNIALLLIALSAYGLRVFLPMYMEPDRLAYWINLAGVKCVLLPENEFAKNDSHHKEKEQIKLIKNIASDLRIQVVDVQDGQNTVGILPDSLGGEEEKDGFPPAIGSFDSLQTEALIVTTSGTSEDSKLVVYTQGAILNSCLSWETAGFFSPEIMGGRSFTPLISHTMGVRGLFNALWSGHAVCLINSSYYTEKPEIARYFLMEMKPENITGGPALYQMLLEMIRLFPELRDGLRQHLQTLVSSGTNFNPTTLKVIEDAFEKPLHNAFGTTETHQVTNTLLSKENNSYSDSVLGGLLPGVEIELKPTEDNHDLYSLQVYTPFMHKRVLGKTQENQPSTDKFFATKDLIKIGAEGQLIFVGREDYDFLKDGFGVKIPLASIRGYYETLIERYNYVHFVPVNAYPGLAVLIFDPDSQELVRRKDSVKRLIKDINSNLRKQLTPFEYKHRHIAAYLIISETAPLTSKGNVSIRILKKNYSRELKMLENLFNRQTEISLIEDDEPDVDPFSEFSNPYLGFMIRALKTNWSFHRGRGDELYSHRDGKELAVIDFVGGYGTGLLGHNHPAIRKSISDFLDKEAVPLSDQFSSHDIIGRLARDLENEVSSIHKTRFVTLFGSTGSEVVEMALHHAYLEWTKKFKKIRDDQFRQFADVAGNLVQDIWDKNQQNFKRQRVSVVSHVKGYHGLTSGARAILGEGERKKPFTGLFAINSIQIDDQMLDWKAILEKKVSEATFEIKILKLSKQEVRVEKVPVSLILASIFEPILGEGGVRELAPGVLEYFAEQSYPLIIDEIQTGLGRTGEFLASQNVKGDYYLLSKSLGGNYHKLAALLIRKSRFITKFQKHFLSTFSMGALAAQSALTSLSIVRQDQLAKLARGKGSYLMDGLSQLMLKFPSLIKRVGGRGLMCGLQMCDMLDLESLLIRTLYKHKLLAYFCSAYLLNVHQIRVLPTLSASDTLRFEPSAYISHLHIDKLLKALDSFFYLVETKNTYELFKFLMDGDPFTDNRGFRPEQGLIDVKYEKPVKGARRIASIVHFAYPTEELRIMDPCLAQGSDTGLRILFSRFQAVLAGKTILLSAKNLHKGTIHLSIYLLTADSGELERLQKEGRRNKTTRRIQKAVNLAAKNGAEVISLGGFTSILTRNGTQIVPPPSSRITTGNSLTAGMGIRRMFNEIEKKAHLKEDVNIALVGSTGNIGSLIGRELIIKEGYSRLVLISRRKVSSDMIVKRYRLPEDVQFDQNKILVSTNLSNIQSCNFIVAVSNSSDPIIFPSHIRSDTQVNIFDVSIPSAVSMDVHQMENVNVIPFTAYAALPHDPNYVISTCLPRGTMFCCMAEGILCALEDVNYKLTGRIDPEAVDHLVRLAEKQGLTAGSDLAKSFKKRM
ncbi:MAG: aminotransferase class III-fold pyridoxal phosphate-dependent enzyme [Bacteroidetes bacterium]|jgi:acetylornithine/succinyldiaminopimelate/putrescine aminotransferase/predicted amino acid dehydrogenase/acyl-coenzyme A synthetase/AMP-(fatty) acid ligase|nr:aminotransferase class III-fold pyridoxal phosphate-dependent enzyme [Bacteroidota bacterium]MBT3749434.1 aminotransferase class III-fold pyridoxal phosphate-dependent enzyme [Bacteroidota bacterium]MBT4398806.1 aminotransferase class III-fold pyridoxal phosphate-dependent enzyme [Bacteroidota bacterium]MBT4411996.1 aminotransferase class III-fold pyridoxal phosphate-dependent enzyme [Bacteroidota bacterium]MBT7093067.1 aminotransferase class III-fold pyridoxal phosphate-dependent enzyme [Ba